VNRDFVATKSLTSVRLFVYFVLSFARVFALDSAVDTILTWLLWDHWLRRCVGLVSGWFVMGEVVLDSPEFVSQVANCDRLSLSVEEYLAGRACGATHSEVAAISLMGPSIMPMYLYVDLRRCGATHLDICEAAGFGLAMNYYLAACEAGAVHTELVEAKQRGYQLSSYARGRAVGATHAELIAAAGPGKTYCVNYVWLRGIGCADSEANEVLGKGVDMDIYAGFRVGGKDHQQAFDESLYEQVGKYET
jgi:hypothetical protein